MRLVSHMLHDEAVRVAFVRGGIDVKGPDGVRDGRGYIDGVRRLEDDGGLRYGSAVTVGDATAKAHLCTGSVRDQQGRKEGQEGKNRSHDESFDGCGSFFAAKVGVLFELDAYHRLTKSYLVLSAPVAAPGRPIFVGEMAVGRVASASESFLAFAELPQASRRTFWRLRNFRKRREELFGVCGTSASVSESFLVFAELPQVLRRAFWRLRESRKCLKELFGVCGNPASVSKNFLVFAGTPQVPRKTFWRLREPRKCLEELFGVCGNPASVSKNFLVFAGTPQVSRKTFWRLREPRKHFQSYFGRYHMLSMTFSTDKGISFFCRTDVIYDGHPKIQTRRDRHPLGHYCALRLQPFLSQGTR